MNIMQNNKGGNKICFEILSATDENENSKEDRFVGNSIMSDQLTEFCGKAPRIRKHFCIPGDGVQDVIAAMDEVSRLAPTNTMNVITVGTNNVQRTSTSDGLYLSQVRAASFGRLLDGTVRDFRTK
ncbi:hypothetical protein O3P69_014310 [Scylla paramamosain]|uniref:Uncharacterized protein n=1 Tax=Scylla paramamosain TaxID=85552 RepID=A0AAW0TBW3_SCYPA